MASCQLYAVDDQSHGTVGAWILIPEVLELDNDAGFLLKHFEDEGDHVLVDEDFNCVLIKRGRLRR